MSDPAEHVGPEPGLVLTRKSAAPLGGAVFFDGCGCDEGVDAHVSTLGAPGDLTGTCHHHAERDPRVGTAVGSDTLNAPVTTSPAITRFLVGNGYAGSSHWPEWVWTGWAGFSGSIADVLAYNFALSPSQVLAHYRAR